MVTYRTKMTLLTIAAGVVLPLTAVGMMAICNLRDSRTLSLREQVAQPLVNKVLEISENRDGKPGISFEEQAWMARELGYQGPIYEGQTAVTLSSGGASKFYPYASCDANVSISFDDPFYRTLTNDDLARFIRENETANAGGARR